MAILIRTATRAIAWTTFAVTLVVTSAGAESFDFVALGDTAYNVPEDYPRYERLIDAVNGVEPAFSIHVGDIFGVAQCTEALYRRHLDFFSRFKQPVIYTPGDNEWVDCHFSEPGLRDPDTKAFDTPGFIRGRGGEIGIDKLALLRRVFFAEPKSLGRRAISLERQADEGAHPQMVENARWRYNDVIFSTFHIPGTNNALSTTSEASSAEVVARNQANIAWLEATFERARQIEARALVLAFHAEMFEMVHAPGQQGGTRVSTHALRGGSLGPFFWFAYRLAQLAEDFDGQILLIHGDGHRFVVDRPMTIFDGESEPPLRPNISRLQVYGAPEVRAVLVTVDTETPWVFSFSPLYK